MRIAHCVLILLLQYGFIGFGNCLSAQESTRTYRVIDSSVTYDKVLDLVFQQDENSRYYDFCLRFEPQNAPELQIYIKQKGPQTEVVEYISLSGNLSSKVDEIVQNVGKVDAAEIAKQIQVNKRIIKVPIDKAYQWWIKLPDTMAATIRLLEQRRANEAKGKTTMILHGTRYSFSYKQGIGDLIFASVMDDAIGCPENNSETELARWMNRVRCDVEKLGSSGF